LGREEAEKNGNTFAPVTLQQTTPHHSLGGDFLRMVTAIVTFANGRLAHMHRRFKRQVREFGVFGRAFVWTERDLDGDFCKAYDGLLRPEIRGFGYWVWKPQVILQALELLNEGDILVYLDSGSHLNPRGRERFSGYVRESESSATGILAFQTEHREGHWTKGDLLDFYSVRGHDAVVDSGQIQAGALVIQKRATSADFMRKWLHPFAFDVGLVDNSPSQSPNDPGFRAHRNDQSVFSLIAKDEGIATLSASEQYPSGEGMTWADLNLMPFHHRRDKSTAFEKLAVRFAERSVPLQVFLVKTKALILRLTRGTGGSSSD